MASISKYSNASVLLVYVVCFLIPAALARPATYLQDFRTTWGDTHIRQLDGGRAIQLVLDQNSGTTPTHTIILHCLLLDNYGV